MYDKIIRKINSVGFEDAISQTAILTEEDKARYLEKGYFIPLTRDEFVKIYDINPEYVWYAPVISCASYYLNKKTMAICTLHLEITSIKSITSQMVSGFIDIAEKCAREKDYYHMIYDFPARMQFQYLKMLIENSQNDFDLFPLFLTIYCKSDFGFDVLDPDLIRYLIQQKSKEAIAQTQERIANLPETVRLYRGEGSKSTPYKQAFSWTRDINCAYFFACRFGDENAKIIIAEADKKDVIEYVVKNCEDEIFIDPQNVRVVSKIQLKGIDFLREEIEKLADVFLEYKGLLQGVSFAHEFITHGKEHTLRVLLLCLILADCYQLSLRDQSVLALAAVFHDSQRKNDGEDREHGEDGARHFVKVMRIQNDIVEFLCKYHSIPDEEGIQAIGNLPYSSERLEEITLMYRIFKDADALDRVRFGFRDLDVNMLRTPIAKEFPLVARLVHEGLKL